MGQHKPVPMWNWCAGRRPPPTELSNLQGPEADRLARGGGFAPKAVGASQGTPQDHGLHCSNKAADLAWRQENAEEEEEEVLHVLKNLPKSY